MLFLILLVIFTLYLFFRFRSVFPGVRGTFFAAAILVVFFGGFYLREHFAGMLLEAIFTVWFCEAMLLFLAWDVFRLIRRLAVRKPLDAKIRLCGNRIVFGLGILLSAIFFAFGVPVNNRYRTKELVVEIPKISEPFTAVFFSDLHIDPLFHRQKLERLAAEMDSIGPDFVLFGGEYWNNLINWDFLVETGMINAADLKIFHPTSDIDEAYSYVTGILEKRSKVPSATGVHAFGNHK